MITSVPELSPLSVGGVLLLCAAIGIRNARDLATALVQRSRDQGK